MKSIGEGMNKIDMVAVRRVNKAEHSTEVSPGDVLNAALDDIETGASKPTSMLIVALEVDKDGYQYYSRLRSNLNRVEELALLEHAKSSLMEEWKS